VGVAVVVIIFLAFVIGIFVWLATIWVSGSDTLSKQNILTEDYNCYPVSVTDSGFWQAYNYPPGTPDLLNDEGKEE
jgi:hypothetical protein